MPEPGLVSVIIPIYNIGQYLERCLNSVLSQTYRNLEIILVNDGSTDNSLEICKAFAEKDGRVIVINQENIGLGGARNSGLDVMRGEWLCFIDGDDYVDGLYVETLLTAAVKNNCLTAQCMYKEVMSETPSGISLPDASVKVFNWRDYMYYVYFTPGHSVWGACFNIFHCSLFSGVRFGKYKRSEDIPAIARVMYNARSKPCVTVNSALYFYYLRPQSLSRGKMNLKRLEGVSARSEAARFWENLDEPELHAIYWEDYYKDAIEMALCCRRDIPEEFEKFSYLIKEIELGIDKAMRLCPHVLDTPVGAKRLWEKLAADRHGLIVYNLNDAATAYIVPWLYYFNIEPSFICTKECIDLNADKDAFVLIAADGAYIAYSAQVDLRNAGFSKFLRCDEFFSSLRFALYKNLLPGLLNFN